MSRPEVGMKVYIGCFGSGLGHTSRMLEVARSLVSRGDEVQFSSSGEAADLIAARGYRCNVLPLADVRYSEAGEFQVKESLLDSPVILGRTLRQLEKELAGIQRFSPDVVLSDSALSTVLAGRVLRVPTFTVLNQLNLASTHGSPGPLSRLLSVGTSAGMARLWKFSDEILLPDLPPPYTISEKNLWGSNLQRIRYVGFLFSTEGGAADEASAEFSTETRPRVFWQVSGPPRTRPQFLKFALRAATALSEEYAFVVTGGDPGGDLRPVRFEGGWYYGWCANAGEYFRDCDVVVSRAGHGTIAQTITSSKPSLLVPIPKQPEQEGNADKAVRLGVSKAIRQEDLSIDSTKKALGSLLADGYAERSSALGRVARTYDARSAILQTMESAAGRGRR